jgi:AmiR/NasT family two-component response regulator
VLDLYRDTPGGLTDQGLTEASAWAAAAAELLLRLQAQARPPTELHPQLTGGTADRAEIHQATGMIAAQTRLTVADALPLLRARAYATGRSMLAVARDVLAHRTRFDHDQPT